MMTNLYEQAAEKILDAKTVIASTGAGISAESGIPTFREAGGIWEKYPATEYASIDAYVANPHKVWAFWKELSALRDHCLPNAGHLALAELEDMGLLHAVVTQNVDNLHQDAGSRRVIEYHGNSKRLVCLKCHHDEPFDVDHFPSAPPHCLCGGLMKPGVVMFGELIPQRALIESEALAQSCDVCIVVGTSAQVYPAAHLPITAKERGAYIVEVNIEETGFTEFITDAPVPSVTAEQSVADAVELMKSLGRDCVVVLDGERPVGVFTERDFLNRVCARKRSPLATSIGEVMTPDPETLRPRDCITYAINRMAVRGYRNVPIVDDERRVIGLLSVRDVVSHLNEVFAEVEDVASDERSMPEWIDIGGGG